MSSHWAVHVDENGETYYYNVDNPEETAWDLPEDGILVDQGSFDGIDQESYTESEPPSSEPHFDDISFGYPQKSFNDQNLPATIWTEAQTEEGDLYYYNSTGETAWDPPNYYISLSGEVIGEQYQVDPVPSGDLPEPVQEPPTSTAQVAGGIATSGRRQKAKHRQSIIVSDFADDVGYVKKSDDSTDFDVSLINDTMSTTELISAVNSFFLETYAEKYYNFERKGLFKSRTTTEKILSWKGDTISTSLLKLPNRNDVKPALECFRAILSFMGDRPSSKPPIDHVVKVLSLLSRASDDLKTEIFCQICKQTTNNPSLESETRGWNLLMILTSANSVSESVRCLNIYYHIYNFLCTLT